MESEKTSPEKPTGPKRLVRTFLTIFVALAFVLAVAARWLSKPIPDPTYQGKPLSMWLTQYDTNGLNWPRQENSADEAVRQIGTNGFPLIAELLSASDSPQKTKLVIFLQDTFHTQHIPIPMGVRSRQEALNALGALGNEAKPLVPVLARGIDRDQILAEGYSAHWLQSIGPDGEAAVPVIIRKLQATNRTMGREFDVFTLARIGVHQTNLVFPILRASLSDSDKWVRWAATNVLLQPAWAPLGKTVLTNLPEAETTGLEERSNNP